jgi:hypothetical protein
MRASSDLLEPVELPEVTSVESKLAPDLAGYWKQEYTRVVEDYKQLIAAVRDNDRATLDKTVEVFFQ